MRKSVSSPEKTEVLLFCQDQINREKLKEILQDFLLRDVPEVRMVYRMISEGNPSLIITDSSNIDISTMEQNIPILLVCEEKELQKKGSLPSHIWDYIITPFQPDLIRRRVKSYVAGSYQIQNNSRQMRFIFNEKMEALEKMAGGIAHDFNNILGGILAASELLEDEIKENPRALEYTGMIRESSGKAVTLIQRLSEFAQNNRDSDIPVDVHSTISQSLTLLQSRIDQRISIECHLEAEDFWINGIQSDLQTAIVNIILRSSRTMPGGGSIKLTTENRLIDEEYCNKSLYEICPGKYIVLEIRDNGTGIPPEDLPHIFEPFYKREYIKGSSLELAGVYSTITHLNGAIELKSIPENSTSFILLIPAGRAVRDCIETVESVIQVKKEAHILVVDDEPILRKMLTDILEKEGYKVDTADNGKNGLFQFRKNPDVYDLIIMDMVMPEMTGADCFDAIKRINPEMKILFISGYFKDQNMRGVNESDTTGFIHKPFRREAIITKVREML